MPVSKDEEFEVIREKYDRIERAAYKTATDLFLLFEQASASCESPYLNRVKAIAVDLAIDLD